MLKLKFLSTLGISLFLSCAASITVLAVSTQSSSAAEPERLDTIICPCSDIQYGYTHIDYNEEYNEEYEEEYDDDDIDNDDDDDPIGRIVRRRVRNPGGGTGDTGGDGAGGDGTGDGTGGGDGTPTPGGCPGKNKCPECGNCPDCDPKGPTCPKCCTTGRRCGVCIYCAPIRISDAVYEYNGMEQEHGFTMRSTVNYEVKYEAVPDSGAILGENDLPYHAGKYKMTLSYSNNIVNKKETVTVTIKPAAIVFTNISIKTKIYDGTTDATIDSLDFTGVFECDESSITLDKDSSTSSFISPNAGNNIPVKFTEFSLGGSQSGNYYIVHPKDNEFTGNITRASVFGGDGKSPDYENGEFDIEGLVRINETLTFTDSSLELNNYTKQWYTDGKPILHENNGSYKITHDKVDTKISLKIISPCNNYEAVSKPTVYVPYTINIIPNHINSDWNNDNIYIGEKSSLIAYAPSKGNDNSIDITYTLTNINHLPMLNIIGTDSIEITNKDNSNIVTIVNSHSGTSTYSANPADAVNGAIDLTATFYHEGVSISSNKCSFTDVYCGYVLQEQHEITITNIGNIKTGEIDINKNSATSGVFYISKNNTTLEPGGSDSFYISKHLGYVPQGLGDELFTANINIHNLKYGNHGIPVSMYIKHKWDGTATNGWSANIPATGCLTQNYSHTRTCTGCPKHETRSGTVTGAHAPGAAATCVNPQRCTRCSGILVDALGHADSRPHNGFGIPHSIIGDGNGRHTLYWNCSRCGGANLGGTWTHMCVFLDGSCVGTRSGTDGVISGAGGCGGAG